MVNFSHEERALIVMKLCPLGRPGGPPAGHDAGELAGGDGDGLGPGAAAKKRLVSSGSKEGGRDPSSYPRERPLQGAGVMTE